MPIKPENKKLYPKNWDEIRQNILKRAKNRCEFCGVENHIEGFRLRDSERFVRTDNDVIMKRFAKAFSHKIIKIVLTIAHLDHDPTNNDPNNLRALCQRCHNRYDVEHRKETRKKSKEVKNGEV